jgi:hypothetical protein
MEDLPWRTAIRRVLESADSAMHYADIAEEVTERELRSSVGATPANTVNAVITTDINEKDEDSLFIRVNRGEYMLRDRGEDREVPDVDDEHTETEPTDAESLAVEDAGVVKAFGMYWQRQLVDWSNSPKLLGEQSRGAKQVDFCSQLGVYLLHDRERTVYVGRTTDQPLGRRLYQHTYDRLNGRWNRFSWFGLLPVRQDGTFVTEHSELPEQKDLVTTLESVLIEIIEPPQNRKRGDNIRAVEYLQSEDPNRRDEEVKTLLHNLIEERI